MRAASSPCPPAQQVAGLGEGAGRRRVEEGQVGGVPSAPAGQVEGEAGEVGLENLRPGEGDQGAGLGLLPQAVADARLGAAGPAPALVGGGAGDAHRLQPGQATGRVVARHAGEPAVDDDPDALDGQAGLGDAGRQNDLAAAGRGRADGGVLVARVEGPEQRAEVDIGRQPGICQPVAGAQDLALARQEDQ